MACSNTVDGAHSVDSTISTADSTIAARLQPMESGAFTRPQVDSQGGRQRQQLTAHVGQDRRNQARNDERRQ